MALIYCVLNCFHSLRQHVSIYVCSVCININWFLFISSLRHTSIKRHYDRVASGTKIPSLHPLIHYIHDCYIEVSTVYTHMMAGGMCLLIGDTMHKWTGYGGYDAKYSYSKECPFRIFKNSNPITIVMLLLECFITAWCDHPLLQCASWKALAHMQVAAVTDCPRH